MADTPAKSETSGKPLKEQYIPLEQRESQNIDWKPFAWRTVKFFVVAKLGAVIGTLIGKRVGMKPYVKVGAVEYNRGGDIGAVLGATYELYEHWRETKGKQLRVNDLSTDLKTVIDPTQIEKETHKEQALIEDMKKLEALLEKREKSHSHDVTARRDALSKENGLS